MPELTVTDGFDPDTVPRYPMLLAEIRQSNVSPDSDADDAELGADADGEATVGEYVGLVDGELVASDEDLEPVRAAIIATAARTAGRRLGGGVKAIRVRGHAPGGAVFSMVVTSTGEVYDTTTTATVAQSVARAPEDEHSDEGSKPAGRRLRRKPRKAPLPTPDLDSGTKGRPHPILVLIVAMPLAVIVFLVVWAVFLRGGDDHEAVTRPGPQQLPVVAPEGYSPVARWAVKLGNTNGGTSGGVAVDAAQVYAISGSSDHLTAYAADSGVRAWSTDLGSSVTSGPSVTTVNHRHVIAAATTDKLYTLDPATGTKIGEWKLSGSSSSSSGAGSGTSDFSGGQVRMTATGPVVTGQSNIARVIDGAHLVARVMPAGAVPVAPGPDGSLIAATRDRIYVSTSATVSGAGSAITPATNGTVTVAGWTGTRLVLAYTASTSSADGVRLAAYAAPHSATGVWRSLWTSELLASTSIPVSGAETQLPLVTGPAGEWGIFAGTDINLATGATQALGDQWTTSAVGDAIGFGTGSNQVLSVGPNGIGGHSDTEPSNLQVVAPQAVVGSSAYLVTSGGGTTSWLYSLTPLRDQPQLAPSSAPATPSSTPSSSPTSAAAKPTTTRKPSAPRSSPAKKPAHKKTEGQR